MTSFIEIEKKLEGFSHASRIAVVSSDDEHTLQAVMEAENKGIVTPIFLGKEKETKNILEDLGYNTENLLVEDISTPEECALRAADLAREGKIDCIMKGKIETGTLMKVMVNHENGIKKSSVMSAFGIFETQAYHKVVAITDMGLNPYPNLEQKKSIIQNAVEAMHKLGVEIPKVAVLAAVEKVNPKMTATVDAAELKKMNEIGEISACIVEGPISGDLATDLESAKVKNYESPVAGDADILVVPDIQAGNILAKLLCTMGGAKTCGVMLGSKVPLISVSRGASAYEKYMSILLGAVVGHD